MVVMKAAW
jgi:hypothetical protein